MGLELIINNKFARKSVKKNCTVFTFNYPQSYNGNSFIMPLSKQVLPVCHVSPVVSAPLHFELRSPAASAETWNTICLNCSNWFQVFVSSCTSFDASLSHHLSFSVCEVWVTTCIAKPCFVMSSDYLLSPRRRFMFCLWWYLLAVFLTFCCLTMISDPGLGLFPAFVS